MKIPHNQQFGRASLIIVPYRPTMIGLYLMNNNSPSRLRMSWSDKENNVVVCFKSNYTKVWTDVKHSCW